MQRFIPPDLSHTKFSEKLGLHPGPPRLAKRGSQGDAYGYLDTMQPWRAAGFFSPAKRGQIEVSDLNSPLASSGISSDNFSVDAILV